MIKTKQIGFTLIELMIVVAIIAILGAIAMPSYDRFMKQSRRADATSGLGEMADRAIRFHLEKSQFIATLADLGITTNLSDEGYYTYAIVLDNNNQDYLITATARPTEVQAGDLGDPAYGAGNCTVLTLSSKGVKGAPLGNDPLGTLDNVPDCW